ncbi:MAG: DedA family protein [Rhodocyclales bacterium]|nr:DedA family protein [Rhodocyclales bacterium]
MEWLNVTAESGLAGLVFASFLASTVIPLGSEGFLWAFLQQHPQQWWPAVLLATLGNTAGGMTTWWLGRLIPARVPAATRTDRLAQAARVARWGSPVLLLSWLPLIGDALCLAAGWLRLHWLPCLLFMAAGKFARYVLVALTATG